MKNVAGLLLIVCTTLSTSCFLQQELPVEYDYSYRGRFDKYDTYDFIIQSDQLTYHSDAIKTLVTNSIESHMKFLGYKQKDKRPDLLLSFSVFVDSLNLRGYSQPDIDQWMTSKDRDLEYNKLDVNINKGTLFIQFFDRKQNTSIWQGYATDKYKRVDLEDARDVQNAVKSILNKYQFFSQDFIKQQEELKQQEKRM